MQNVFAVIDLYGSVDSVTVISSAYSEVFNSCSRPPSIPSSESSESLEVSLGYVLVISRSSKQVSMAPKKNETVTIPTQKRKVPKRFPVAAENYDKLQ